MLAATVALTVGAALTWQAQAQIEHGPATLADTANPRLWDKPLKWLTASGTCPFDFIH
jgi:hypothetical protein